MSKCEQCIVRQFSSLKTLSKVELLRIADCKTSYTLKKGNLFLKKVKLQNQTAQFSRLISFINRYKKTT